MRGLVGQRGPDTFRHANILMNTDELFRARANYSIAQNTITIGYEREALNVFNLFNLRSDGVLHLRLRRGGGQRPHRLQNQTARQLVYANAFDDVKADGAAAFSNVKHKGYLPNEWWPFAGLSLRRACGWTTMRRMISHAPTNGRNGRATVL